MATLFDLTVCAATENVCLEVKASWERFIYTFDFASVYYVVPAGLSVASVDSVTVNPSGEVGGLVGLSPTIVGLDVNVQFQDGVPGQLYNVVCRAILTNGDWAEVPGKIQITVD